MKDYGVDCLRIVDAESNIIKKEWLSGDLSESR